MIGVVTFANGCTTSTSSSAEDTKDDTAVESSSDRADPFQFQIQSAVGSKSQVRSTSEPASVNDSLEWQPFPLDGVANPWSNSSADIVLDPALHDEQFSTEWPLRPYDEAKLLRYYVTEVAVWYIFAVCETLIPETRANYNNVF